MRGDSLRDLYAKALALLGLAALAAIGAVFDYWPVSTDLPRLVHRGLPVVPGGALPVPDLTAVRAMPVAAAVVARSAPSPGDARMREVALPAVPAFVMPAPVALDQRRLGTPVAITAPAVTSDAAFETAAPVSASASLSGSEPVPQRVELFPAPVSSSDNGSAVSFVTDALKKTGDTLVRTGMKTGASIRDAIVSFGGAFRKIL